MKALPSQFYIISAFLQIWHTKATSSKQASTAGNRLILLDVDNTLYRERDAGIESQIVDGTHSYCERVLEIDKGHADKLYNQYGSTVEGLQHTIWKDLSNEELQEKVKEFYHAVYDNVDPSSIFLANIDPGSGSTGYSHASKEELKLASQLLKFSPIPIGFASNSPSWHVCKVLRALGLEKMSKDVESYTPDRLPMYPTKHKPEDFFSDIDDDDSCTSGLSKYDSVSFLDDSLHNLIRVKEAFPLLVDEVHHINRSHQKEKSEDTSIMNGKESLVQALLQEFGLIDPSFRLSQTRYLETKNKVDRRSLHADLWNKIVEDLKEILFHGSGESSSHSAKLQSDLWVVDLGAGLLSMLDLLLHGDHELGLSAFMHSSTLSSNDSKSRTVHYTAYESNQELFRSSHERLLSWGFQEKKASKNERAIDMIDYEREQNGIILRVKLVLRNFADVRREELLDIPRNLTPNLIIGCCFADLMHPEQLVPDLFRSFGLLNTLSRTGTMIYFPITFTGTTQFLPPRPFEFQSNDKTVPSDTIAFQSYSRALETVLGHNLDPFFLQDVMEDHGAKLVDFGFSDWKIDPKSDLYLYETMLYFFGSTGGPQLLKEGWDASRWIQRARNNQPSIRVSNRDLLFCVKPIEIDEKNLSKQSESTNSISEILFTAPSQVTSVMKNRPSKLGPTEILGKSSISL